MLNLLLESNDEVYFYCFNHANSCEASELRAVCSVKSKELLAETEIDFNDGCLNIICGSLYMISELVERFNIDLT